MGIEKEDALTIFTVGDEGAVRSTCPLGEEKEGGGRRDGNLDGSNEYACDNCDHM